MLLFLGNYKQCCTQLLKVLHKCNTDVLRVLLIYLHSPSRVVHIYQSNSLLQCYNISMCSYVNIPYIRKFLWYEIFAEQETSRIFAIIFLRITGSSWKGSMLCTVKNLQLLQTSKFSWIKFSLHQ